MCRCNLLYRQDQVFINETIVRDFTDGKLVTVHSPCVSTHTKRGYFSIDPSSDHLRGVYQTLKKLSFSSHSQGSSEQIVSSHQPKSTRVRTKE